MTRWRLCSAAARVHHARQSTPRGAQKITLSVVCLAPVAAVGTRRAPPIYRDRGTGTPQGWAAVERGRSQRDATDSALAYSAGD